ncbi:hypothetical protein ACOQFV_20850 [Nocardiopsis changdeensis]|uniref:Uncharacterized protein n=1 Tax=Nocardiopsis changdeensis TaxID=2831969 RepID=A0ABX8BYQ1_9ACTN|nr:MULTISPECIES: hypothetical protein [Nocardiopsis]QUX26324.1 hypothetical protein KGD84_20545 [Nocardiopsis changdeensis]QYX40630.1 hypothetical protein K1J57_30000 [Nocardiopsis sp. MT53]
MARYRYLNCSEPVAARWPAGEALRRRRPRRAARARAYVTHPARDLAPLTLAVRRWLARQNPTPPALPPFLPAEDTTPLRPRVPAPRTSPDSDPGFAAAVASRPRIRALRSKARTRPESTTAKSRAAARLRVRTATIRSTTRLTADRDGLWKDALAAARILKRNLGRAA